jgi:LMBR1 domain-containing protein 1
VLSSNYEYTSTARVNEISKFIVNTKMPAAFNAVRCTSEKHLKETLLAVGRVARWVETHLKLTFTEMVCDFIRDEGGNWWYLNTRAFILAHDVKVDVRLITMHDDVPVEAGERRRLESYTRCRKCRYCYKVIAEHLMTHRLTLMMILQCDQHLIRLGKNFPWLDRSYQLHLDAVNLYVEHKVCHSCYKFYTEVQRLVALEERLARLTGVRIPADNKNAISITAVPYFRGEPAQFGTRLQRMKYESEMPAGWELPLERQLKV